MKCEKFSEQLVNNWVCLVTTNSCVTIVHFEVGTTSFLVSLFFFERWSFDLYCCSIGLCEWSIGTPFDLLISSSPVEKNPLKNISNTNRPRTKYNQNIEKK
uniref:Uncharacterized protein n=1 Tax=Amphimedon queenslandica TaxID=400682 RepID=A0A1X7U2I0_AMPQE